MPKFLRKMKDDFFSSIHNFTMQTKLLFALFVLTPFINFFMIELVNGDFSVLRHLIAVLNILVIGFLMITVFMITNSMKISIISITALSFIFSYACYFVYKFRGSPLYFTDLSTIGAAAGVAGEYDYTLTAQMIIQLIVSLLVTAAAIFLKEKQHLEKEFRLPLLGIYGVCFVLFLYIFVFSTTLASWNVKIHHFHTRSSYRKNGAVVSFIRTAQMTKVDRPEGYSIEAVQALADKIKDELGEDVSQKEAYKNPNVIVIMNESFADIQSLGELPTSEEVMPFINGLTENTVKGKAYVSVYGGKTVNSEFEFLTGDSMFFLPKVVPYQMLIRKPIEGLTSTLLSQGYEEAIAMHPYKPGGYSRNKVYPLLGFSQYLSQKDFSKKEITRIRKWISDDTDVKRIISEYEEHKQSYDSPFYMFNVTMQNHGPYDEDYDNFDVNIKITDPNYYNAEAERFINLAHLSDASLETLVDYFEQVDEDTVIVFFGDHMPRLDEEFYEKVIGKPIKELSEEENMERYQVPFLIWSNYDIEERENEKISLNYLAAYMFEVCHLEETPFYRYLNQLREEVPVLTVNGFYGKDGTFYSDEEDSSEGSPYDELLQEYRLLQYNNVFDDKNRVEDFFD